MGAHLGHRQQRARRLVPWAVVVAAYVVLAMVANLPAWIHGPTHEIQNYGGDLPEGAWFLAATPYALLHGHNPFFTNYINYPYGANLMTNTTMFVPGVVLASITLIWGSVAAFNVAMVLAIAGSATAAFAVFLRWVSWKPAAFAGGLLYGFSPYMVGAGYGHLNVLIIVFPPLLLLLLDNILVRQRGRPIWWGLLLGLVAAAQFFTSTDILASAALMAAAGTIVLIVARPHWVSAKLPFASRSLGTALVTFVVLCSYPLHVLVSGPQHIIGTTQPLNSLAAFSSDLLSSVLPTMNQAISPPAFQHIANTFVQNDFSENGAYLGIPLLMVLLFFIVRFRRFSVVRFGTVMLLVAYVLSLGGRLRIDGHITPLRLPFDVFRHLPLLDNLLAVRFSIYVFFFAALILAVGIDGLRQRSAVERPSRSGTVAAGALAAFALFPLIPSWPYSFRSVPVPAYFRSSAVSMVPEGSVLLTYPFPTAFHAEPMIWQAADGFRYRMPGGYVITPGPDGHASLGKGSTVESLFEEAYQGAALPELSLALRCDIVNDLRIWNIDTIVVTDTAGKPDEVIAALNAALNERPTEVAGAYVYADTSRAVNTALNAVGCQPTSYQP